MAAVGVPVCGPLISACTNGPRFAGLGDTAMRLHLFGSAVLLVVALGTAPAAAVKRVPYPEIKVEMLPVYDPEPAFAAMRRVFADAVAKKDSGALFALVGPTFVWTAQGELAGEFDMGRDALHNFKVVFGFRNLGKDADGGVDKGPFWTALAAFAEDGTYYRASEGGNLICGPIGAAVSDEQLFEQAQKKINAADEVADWYFPIGDASVAKAPGDTAAPAKLGKMAVPVLGSYPPNQERQPGAPTTHFEVLLPSGKSGWVPAATVRPLVSERLCYAKTASGEWKIVRYDQPE